MAKGIYLDNSMAARPSDMAVSRMLPYLNQYWGSSSSPHQMGRELFPAIRESLQSIYALLGAKDHDTVLFTSSGAEAVNHAVMAAYHAAARDKGKNHFLTSNIEEAPSIMAISHLQHFGCVGKMAQANSQGKITAQIIADALSPRTAMVTLSWANGLTGVINPVREIASLCKERGVIFHLDATHVLGKLYYELEEIGADFISFNGDQLHAPKGTGGLFIHSKMKAEPFIFGGTEQAGLRAGSMNTAGLVSLGQAAKEAVEARDLVCTEVARLRNQFESGIMESVPDAIVFFKDEERLPHCTAIGFPGVANEALLFCLDRNGVFASIGGGNFQQITLVLQASGVEEVLSGTAINFSLSRETTDEEIDKAVEIVAECVKKLRKTSIKFMEDSHGN